MGYELAIEALAASIEAEKSSLMAEERKPVTKKEGTFDKDLIRELAELLEETGLTEIEIEHEGKRVRVARDGHGRQRALSPSMPAVRRARQASAAPRRDHHPGTVHSRRWSAPPIARRSLAPRLSSKIGTKVTAGQTILIIEAMKTMNHIPAPHAGTVLAVLVDDGQPVEYAEPLAVIEKG